MGKEPCARCGEETAIGSVFFSDRHVLELDEGPRSYLCSDCNARIRAAGRGRQLTDAEVRRVVERGSAAGITWAGGDVTPGGT